MKVVGYITSDFLNNGFVPHNIQNITIKNFLSKNNHEFMLSWTEYKNKSQLAFNSLLEESYYQGICFFSWEQLKNISNAQKILSDLLSRGMALSFAREGLWIENQQDFERFYDNYFLVTCMYESASLGQWLNERKNYF